MKIFGRKPERYILGLKRLPQFLAASWRAFFIFKQPLSVIWSYIIRQASPVRFPRNSDVMNSILPDSTDNDEFDLVQAISLSEMVSRMNSIDLLKSDCEGAEYDIFLHGNEKDIAKISEIRMEYHVGPRDELFSKLTGLGYTVRQFMSESIGGDYLWLTRNKSQ